MAMRWTGSGKQTSETERAERALWHQKMLQCFYFAVYGTSLQLLNQMETDKEKDIVSLVNP